MVSAGLKWGLIRVSAGLDLSLADANHLRKPSRAIGQKSAVPVELWITAEVDG